MILHRPGGTQEHLGALDVVYAVIIEAHRGSDLYHLVTQDMLIGQARQLEEFYWFVRAHLETPDGSLSTGGARTEQAAAKQATASANRLADAGEADYGGVGTPDAVVIGDGTAPSPAQSLRHRASSGRRRRCNEPGSGLGPAGVDVRAANSASSIAAAA